MSSEINLKEIQFNTVQADFKSDLIRFFDILNGDVNFDISTLYRDGLEEERRELEKKHDGLNLKNYTRNSSRFELYKIYQNKDDSIIITYGPSADVKSEYDLSAYWVKKNNQWCLIIYNMQLDSVLTFIKATNQ